jgi:hypothetical protein
VPPLNVQLLWWEGCPSTESARELVRTALDELGHSDVEVDMLEIDTDEKARVYGFHGSPTILIDSVDLMQVLAPEPEATSQEGESALTCRLYRRRDGRISPTPDPADVREAIIRAVERRQTQRSEP